MNEELKYTASVVGFDKVEKALKDQAKDLNGVAVAATRYDAALSRSVKGTNQAAFALQNFGRIAQDAPFGIIGITNNINPLLESFQRLKAETGTTGGAIKALASSFFGAGGLGVAVSLASAALTFFALNNRGAKDTLDGTSKSAKEAAEALQSVFASTAKEVAQVEVLVESFKKENLTRKEKQNIIEQLQRISPAYFSTLDKENTSIEQLTKAYDAYSRSIIRAIEIKIREGQLNKVIERRLELQDKSVKLTNIEVDENGKLRRTLNAVYNEDIKGRTKSLATILLTTAEQKELNDLLRTEKELVTGLANLKQPQDFLEVEKVKKVKEEFDKLKKIILDLPSFKLKSTNDFIHDLQEFQKKLEDGTLPQLTVPVTPVITLPDPSVWLKDFSEKTNAALESIAENAAISFGETLGNALAGQANIGDFFKGIFHAFGAGMKELGKFFVQTAIEIAIVKKLLFKNPYTAAIAGIALIALGSLIEAKTSKQAFAKGGFVGGTGNTDSVNALLMPGEFVMTKSAVQRIGVGNLSALNSGVSAPVSFSGGISAAEPMVFIADSIISGNDIVLSYRRATATKSRIG